MNLYIDIKYAKLAGLGISLFKLKKMSPFLAMGRCPICGDSQTNKFKCRFFFYEKQGKINASCHNCGYSASIGSYLKAQEPLMFKQYCLEIFGKNDVIEKPKQEDFIPEKIAPIVSKLTLDNVGLPLVKDLHYDNHARVYIESRNLPEYPFLYAKEFCKFASQFNKDFATKKEHARVIIPFFGEDGSIHAFQARTLGNDEPKYYTVSVEEDSHKIFGIERINKDETVLVVEGPLDSLFLDNCIAARSSSLKECAIKSSRLIYNNPKNDYVLVYDNEPRNKDLCKLIEKAVDENFRVCLLPESWNHKDINDAILAGMQPNDIKALILNNTYQGLSAKLKFNNWKKC